MTKRQFILFLIPSIIWGSTWYAIKFQLGNIDPMVSVSYRFILAGLVLFIISLATGKNMKFSLHEHFLMFLLGLSLFGLNYWFVYKAETSLTSGVVAVIFSLIIFFNIIFNAIFLKGKIKKDVIIAAVLGITGTALLFENELNAFDLDKKDVVALLFCLGGLVSASLGNIISAYKQKKNIPVFQSNAYSMLYGGVTMFVAVLVLGKPVSFDFSASYSLSLLYLAIFGSIISFSIYLKLLGEIGPDRSAYITLISPAIAMVFSTIFENYHWNLFAFAGLAFLFAGNHFIMRFKTQKSVQ